MRLVTGGGDIWLAEESVNTVVTLLTLEEPQQRYAGIPTPCVLHLEAERQLSRQAECVCVCVLVLATC